MEQSRVDVIIPVYNAADYLERCLESVVNQTYKNIRILIINDGSIDKSADIIWEYAKKDDRCEVIEQENKGIGGTRNVGLSNLKSEYFMFLDSDDEIALNYIEVLINKMKQYNADVGIASMIDGKISLLDSVSEELIIIQKNRKAFYEHYVIKNRLYYGVPNKMFRTNTINSMYFEENCNFGEDLLFMLKYYMRIDSIVIEKEAKYYYHVDNQESLTRKKCPDRCYQQYRVCEKFYEYLVQNSILKDNIELYAELMWMLIISGMGLSIREGANKEMIIEYLKKVLESEAYNKIAEFNRVKGANRWINIEGTSLLSRVKLATLIFLIRKEKWKFLKRI